MNFDRAQQELLAYLKENKIWRNFIPIAELLLIVVTVLELLGHFVSFGIFSTVFAILRYVAIVMVLAKANYKVLTIGLGIITINQVITILQGIINRYPSFRVDSLIWGCVYALFTLAAFKKSGMTINEFKSTITSTEGLKNSMNLNDAKQFNMGNMAQDIKSASKNAADQMKDIGDQLKNKDGQN